MADKTEREYVVELGITGNISHKKNEPFDMNELHDDFLVFLQSKELVFGGGWKPYYEDDEEEEREPNYRSLYYELVNYIRYHAASGSVEANVYQQLMEKIETLEQEGD